MNDLVSKIAIHKKEGWWTQVFAVDEKENKVYSGELKSFPLSTFYEEFEVLKIDHLVVQHSEMRRHLESIYLFLYGCQLNGDRDLTPYSVGIDGLRALLVKVGSEVEAIEAWEDKYHDDDMGS